MNKSSSKKLRDLKIPRKITIKGEIIKMVVAALLFLGFCLAFISIPLGNDHYYWILAVVCAGLEVIFLLSASSLSKRLKRAYDYNIFVTIIYLIAFIGGLEIDIWLFVVFLKSGAWLFILLGLIALILGLQMQFNEVKNKLYQSREYNISSGRLNEKTGEWNLADVLHLDVPQVEDERRSSWKSIRRWITPFLPAAGMIIDRNLGPQGSAFLFGILTYVLILLLSWGVAQYLAIAHFLLERERVIGKRIMLVAKNE